jgi:hypothetical protein
MSQSWPLFLAAPLAVTLPAAHATVYLTVEQAQQTLFPGARLMPVERAGRERVWRAESQGWLIVDQVLGKHELITYALALGGDGRVRGLEILEYRESHGGQVREAGWRTQFVGKSAADPLQLDRDIANISGATLSCRHVTEGVKRLLGLYESELRQR